MSLRNPSYRKLDVEYLKRVIASSVTDSEVEKLRKEFLPELDFADLKGKMTEPSNWKQISKVRTDDNKIERIFDCKPLEDQLRCYILTDSSDTRIVELYFQTE